MSIQKKISYLVAQQLPGFVRQDHPKFVAFLEAYYEWLAEQGNAEERIKTLIDNQDIDATLDLFIDLFKSEFLARIPQEILADKRELSKHIKEYYRARGSEKSFKLLFRILFNSDLEFYYPHTDILRASDGKWQIDKTIKVQALLGRGSPAEFESHIIHGASSNATAVVDKIIKYYSGPYEVYELYLNNSSILGTFLPNENIYSADLANTQARIYPIVTGVKINSPGIDYTVGAPINFIGGSGFNAVGKIKSVDLSGSIKSIKMTNFGVGYDIPPVVQFPTSSLLATGTPIIGGMTVADGYYLNQDGQISSSKRIQDSYYYQQFSYVLYVEESIEKYRALVKQLIHPAGLIMFGGIRSVNVVDDITTIPVSTVSGNAASFIRIERESLMPHPGPVHGDTVLGASEVWDGRMRTLKTDVTLTEVVTEGITTYKLGPSLRSFERDKFKAIPSEGNTDASQMLGVNLNYWDQFGNQQIDHFADWVIQDFEFFAYRRINIMPDPVLKSG